MRVAVRTILLATFSTIITQPLCVADDAAKAQKLIDRAITTMGGNKALEKSRNRIIEDEGTFFGMGAGLPYKGRYVYELGNSGRYRVEIIGVFVNVTDGDKGWTSVMGNTTDLDGEILEVAIQEVFVSYVVSLIPLQKPNGTFRLSMAEPETVDGEKCEGITIERDKMRKITMHFSGQSGLIKKTKSAKKAAELEFKEVNEETVFHEYKEFDGFKSPTHITVFRDGRKFVESRRRKTTYPETIDESEFTKPN